MVCDVTIKCRQWEMHTAQIMAMIMVQRLGSMRTMHEFGTEQIRNPANSVSGEPDMLFAYHSAIESSSRHSGWPSTLICLISLIVFTFFIFFKFLVCGGVCVGGVYLCVCVVVVVVVGGGGGATRGITKIFIFPYFDVSNIFSFVPSTLYYHFPYTRS